MLRLILGLALLGAALLTGLLAGGTAEPQARLPLVVRESPRPPQGGSGGAAEAVGEVAPVQAIAEESPETPASAERVRPSPPAMNESQAEEARRFEEDWKRRLHAHGLGIARVLEGDREAQRQAVARMQELRRERADFMAALLGREAWEALHENEKTGGRDVTRLLQEMQEREIGESR